VLLEDFGVAVSPQQAQGGWFLKTLGVDDSFPGV